MFRSDVLFYNAPLPRHRVASPGSAQPMKGRVLSPVDALDTLDEDSRQRGAA
jgi:hypothetical protein